ncbi:hypothetical protein NMG60_11017018 [Bertholletia excelsa]
MEGELDFPNGLGGGGPDGWRRKGKKKIRFVLGTDPIVALGVRDISLLWFSIDGWRRAVKDWMLWFCFCAVLVVLGLRTKNFA